MIEAALIFGAGVILGAAIRRHMATATLMSANVPLIDKLRAAVSSRASVRLTEDEARQALQAVCKDGRA